MRIRVRLLAGAGPLLATWCGSPCLAQSGPDPRSALEEVVVTAEKIGRSIKETATSVEIFDSGVLESRAGLDDLNDVLMRIPNMTQTGNGIGATVRGVDGTGPGQGSTALLAGTRNRLTIQVDGRPITYNEAVYGETGVYDVQQVEVLRGPQSTLQGRNSISGAVAIKTNDPTFELEGGARLVGGSNDFRQGAAHISGPLLGDQVAGRLAVDHQERDSWVKMAPFPQESDPGHQEIDNVRGKLLIAPTALEGFRTILTAQHTEYRGPQIEFVRAPYDDHVSATVPRLQPADPVWHIKTDAAIAASSWEISEQVTFQSTLSYSDYEVKRSTIPNAGIAHIGGREFNIEPRLRVSLLDGRLDWLSGLFYFDSRQRDGIDIAGGASFRDRTRTSAAFTEATLAATDRLNLTVGGRYERETHRRFNVQGRYQVDLDETTTEFLPKAGASYDFSDAVRVGVIASRGYNGGGAGFTFTPPLINFVYEPEYLWNYEVYLRATPSERLSVVANVFYSDYEGMQLSFDSIPGPAAAWVILNAPEVTTHGAEIGVRWMALAGLELFANLGLQDSDLSAPGMIIDGQELSRAPKVTGDLGVSWRSTYGLEVSLDGHYSDGYFTNVVNVAEEKVRPYWLANAQVAYNWSQNVRVFVASTNLFDSDAPLALSYFGLSLDGPPYASLVRPRAFNAGVVVKF